jgi:uncharacterized protein
MRGVSVGHPISRRMAKRKIKLACPGCGKAVTVEQPEFPFCSDRCRTMDLGKWADGTYVVSTPTTAADLLGDADYTMGAVERVPASSIKGEEEVRRKDQGTNNPREDDRKEPDGRKRG